jgi:hypothetical protein
VIEAQLIDLADEVAYNTADLDDAYAAGLICSEDIAEAVPRYREIYETVETQFPGATPRERFNEGLRQLVDVLVTGLIEGTVAAALESGVQDLEAVQAYPAAGRVHTGSGGRQPRSAIPVRESVRVGGAWAGTGAVMRDCGVVPIFGGSRPALRVMRSRLGGNWRACVARLHRGLTGFFNRRTSRHYREAVI